MKLVLMISGLAILIPIALLLIIANVYNFRNDRRPEANEFMSGKVPEPNLDGFYQGQQFTGLGDKWLGKRFTANDNTGRNNFSGKTKPTEAEQRYPFATSQAVSLRNKDQTVLQLNYNLAGNPLWLKSIRDELVEVSPNKYLGKIQLKVGFVVVTLGYFRLER